MAVITKGKKGGYVTAKFLANGAIHLNNSSATGANTVGETVDTMTIAQVITSGNSTSGWTIRS